MSGGEIDIINIHLHTWGSDQDLFWARERNLKPVIYGGDENAVIATCWYINE